MRVIGPDLARAAVGPDDVPALLAFAAAHPVPDLPAEPARLPAQQEGTDS